MIKTIEIVVTDSCSAFYKQVCGKWYLEFLGKRKRVSFNEMQSFLKKIKSGNEYKLKYYLKRVSE